MDFNLSWYLEHNCKISGVMLTKKCGYTINYWSYSLTAEAFIPSDGRKEVACSYTLHNKKQTLKWYR